MRKYLVVCFIFLLISPAYASESDVHNWILDTSKDENLIKTVNSHHDELLVAYYEKELHVFLILKTDSLLPDKILPVSIRIDRSSERKAKLHFLEKRHGQTVMRVEFNLADKGSYLSRMIAGLTILFDFSEKSGGYAGANTKQVKSVSFSLKGFTVALNDLFIINDIGSLDDEWLLHHNKERELFCLMTSNISIEAMQYRLKGESYNSVLHLINKTGYSIIDHNLTEIVGQVYKIPKNNIPYVPRAEKYLMFTNCMEQSSHQAGAE